MPVMPTTITRPFKRDTRAASSIGWFESVAAVISTASAPWPRVHVSISRAASSFETIALSAPEFERQRHARLVQIQAKHATAIRFQQLDRKLPYQTEADDND